MIADSALKSSKSLDGKHGFTERPGEDSEQRPDLLCDITDLHYCKEPIRDMSLSI